MNHRPTTLSCSLLVVLLAASWAPAKKTPSKEFEPPDVYVHVDRVRQELELLRVWMGRPRDEQPELEISGAEPREVFFQAITLFRKANRLSTEQVHQRAREEPTPPAGQIRPAHVRDAVDQALQHVLSVKAKLGLTSKIVPIKRDPDKTPSDVLRSIVQANRQVNLLLERRFSPSDAFQQVTVAMGYCEKLLERFPKAETMPRAPSFKPNKQPGDVYGRLLKASDTIHAIIQASGLQSLELKHPKQALIEGVAPSDVYDIASLLVSELAYLHSQLPDPAPPRTVYFPGRKFPSDVYQRAGILERQLAELGRAIEKNPAWLRP